MASIYATFTPAGYFGAPIGDGARRHTTFPITSGASAAHTIAAPGHGMWVVTVTGGTVLAEFGVDADADTAVSWCILDGETRAFEVREGMRASFRDA